MTERVHVRITGRVQGVGFRYSTVREAHARGINGWVRNAPGSVVEAEFEGEREALEGMLAWCHDGPASAHVERVDASWDRGEPRHTAFTIR